MSCSFGVPIVPLANPGGPTAAVYEKPLYHETHWCWNGATIVFITMQQKGGVLVDSSVFRPE